jgi:Holliday junction resolvase RusA-like endonuclease
MNTISFTIVGKPVTQGSTRVVPIKAKGGGYLMRSDGRPVLRPIHQNDQNLQNRRQEIANAARAVYDGPLLTGALKLTVVIERPRPAGHYGTGRNAGILKTSAPTWPITRPDTLKIVRAVEDALTGVLWQDDSQIVMHSLTKCWGGYAQMLVAVEPLDAVEVWKEKR